MKRKYSQIREISIIIGIVIIITLIIFEYSFHKPSVYTYVVTSENYITQGRHYEYYTKAKCKIVAVSDDKTEVYYEYKGNIYSFYTDGCTDCKPGDKWLFTFAENGEVISIE